MTPAGIALYLVPGLLLAWQGERLRAKLADRGLAARIGVRLVQLSALGYAMRGAFVADAADPGGLGTRLHALGWSLWWIAFFAGGWLLALGSRRGATWALACVVAALLVPLLAVAGPVWFGPGLAAWLAIATWAAWWTMALVAGVGALR